MITENVCIRCPVIKAKSNISFLDKSFKLKSLYIILLSWKSKTIFGSHVWSYFGVDGLNLEIRFKKRFTLESWTKSTRAINEIADLIQFILLYDSPFLHWSVRNHTISFIDGLYRSILLWSQNIHHFLSATS